jgi:hypothetical protein
MFELKTIMLKDNVEVVEIDICRNMKEVESYQQFKKEIINDTWFDDQLIGFEVKEISVTTMFFEIPKKHNNLVKQWLKHFNFVFEPSSMGALIHYEVEVNNEHEKQKINNFLDSLE